MYDCDCICRLQTKGDLFEKETFLDHLEYRNIFLFFKIVAVELRGRQHAYSTCSEIAY